MTLHDFLKRDDTMSQTEMAKTLGVDKSLIGHYVHGRRRPSPEQAARIHELTDGKVDALQWYPELLRVVEGRQQVSEEQAHG